MFDYEKMGMKNYSQYVKFTQKKNWKSICKLNNVPFDDFGTSKEIKVLPNYLEKDEVVFAITSGLMSQTATSNSSDSGWNTWLAVLTSNRFLFLDHAFFTSSVDVQSVRHEMVQSVSASQGWIWGKIIIDLGSRMLTIDNCAKAAVTPFVSLSNTWLSVLTKCKNNSDLLIQEAVQATAKAVAKKSDATVKSTPLDELKKLADLKAAGVLTDEEFATAKAKILAKL